MTLVGRGLGRGGCGSVVAAGLTLRPKEVFTSPQVDPLELCVLSFDRHLISSTLISTIESTALDRKMKLSKCLTKFASRPVLAQTPRNFSMDRRYEVTETEIT